MIVKLGIAGACLIASYVLFDVAAELATGILAELFADVIAESVSKPENVGGYDAT